MTLALGYRAIPPAMDDCLTQTLARIHISRGVCPLHGGGVSV